MTQRRPSRVFALVTATLLAALAAFAPTTVAHDWPAKQILTAAPGAGDPETTLTVTWDFYTEPEWFNAALERYEIHRADASGFFASPGGPFERFQTTQRTTATWTDTGLEPCTVYYYVWVQVAVGEESRNSAERSGKTDCPEPVNEPPVAIISGPDPLRCPVAGTERAFDGSLSHDTDGTVIAWSWDLGDGATASGVATTHTYTTAGDFTVTLNVTDDKGATDETVWPVCVAPVIRAFSLTPTNQNAIVAPGGDVVYEWTVRNRGNVPDRFFATLDDAPPGWDAALLAGVTPELQPTEAATLRARVTAGAWTLWDVAAIDIDVASIYDAAVTASASTTTRADFTDLSQAPVPCPSTTLAYACLQWDVAVDYQRDLKLWLLGDAGFYAGPVDDTLSFVSDTARVLLA